MDLARGDGRMRMDFEPIMGDGPGKKYVDEVICFYLKRYTSDLTTVTDRKFFISTGTKEENRRKGCFVGSVVRTFICLLIWGGVFFRSFFFKFLLLT